MPFTRPVLSFLISLLISASAAAQQTAPPATQGAAVFQQAVAALAPTTPINDVILSGTVELIAGSNDESGTVVVKALAGTGTRSLTSICLDGA